MRVTDAERRVIARWAADCAARVLPLFEAATPGDGRPREAIEGARVFARGGKRTVGLRGLFSGAYAAARGAGDPAATAAARSAGLAAAVAFMPPVVPPDQPRHALGPAVYAALARELAARDLGAADQELRWALKHASPAVRKLLRRMPAQRLGRTRLATLFHQLDTASRR